MKISTFKYFAVDSSKSLTRNKTLSLASIATVAATLFILGVFLLALLDVNTAVNNVESKFEVKVVLKNDVTIGEEQEIKKKIEASEGIQSVSYETKSQALENFREQIGEENEGILEGLDKDNPMPNSYVVKVKKPEYVKNVVENVKGLKGIESVKDGKKIVDKIIAITGTIKWIGSVLFVILAGVSLFLIGNTIKITVYSRRREIGIMKYIGATDWFIRWPFVIEGVIIGLLGGAVACVLLYYGYNFVFLKVTSSLVVINLVKPSYVLTTISWQFALAGVIIGSVGSLLSIRKFLAV